MRPRPTLENSKKHIYAHGSTTPIPVMGKFQAHMSFKNNIALEDIIVTEAGNDV